jgi:hypothetical protein
MPSFSRRGKMKNDIIMSESLSRKQMLMPESTRSRVLDMIRSTGERVVAAKCRVCTNTLSRALAGQPVREASIFAIEQGIAQL